MNEISLHILDLLQNSTEAGADKIDLVVREDFQSSSLQVVVQDNGRGIPSEMLEQITDPFITSRSTRKVGLGLSLMQAAAESCGGYLKIASKLGEGTKVTVAFQLDHIDTPPLGNIAETVIVFLVGRKNLQFTYRHYRNGRRYEFVTTGKESFFDNPLELIKVREKLEVGLKNL